MLAGPLPPRVGHIIAERHPVLRVILDALTAADKANEGTADLLVEVGSLDDVGIRGDWKSTRLNSSHSQISYAVFCLKKKKKVCHAPRWFKTRRNFTSSSVRCSYMSTSRMHL